MQKLILKINDVLLLLFIMLISHRAFADLPTPSSDETFGNGKSAIDVGGTMFFKGLKYGCYIVAVGAIIGTASVVFTAFKQSHDKGEIGHFIKYLLFGLVLISLSLGLAYFGYSVIPDGSLD